MNDMKQIASNNEHCAWQFEEEKVLPIFPRDLKIQNTKT